MAKKFTGGDSLNKDDGLAFYIHKMMMLNELRNGYGAYEISNAVKQNSGLSFGGIQRDISSKQNQSIFEEILKTSSDDNGRNIFTNDEIKQICGNLYKPHKNFSTLDKEFYKAVKSKLNLALSSTEGMNIINQDYLEQIYQKSAHTKNIITNIENPETKTFIQNTLSAQLIISDTFNQFGAVDPKGYSVPEQLVTMLNQPAETEIEIPFSNRVFKSEGEIDIQDMINFKLAVNYGQSQPADTMRRINNIQSVIHKFAPESDLIKNIQVINQHNDEDLTQKDINKFNLAKYLETSINNTSNLKDNYILSDNVQEKLEQQQSQEISDKFNHVLKAVLPDINAESVHITSQFGYRKINNQHNYHGGIDFNYIGNQSGINLTHPDVHSPVAGIVTFANGNSGYGTVKIKDINDVSHEILHLDSQTVKAGQKIEIGDVIGKMGGRGPEGRTQYAQHVHYQIKNEQGKLVNPILWWNSKQDTINIAYNLDKNISVNNSSANNQSVQNIWYPTPLNISKDDERYKNIENEVKIISPEFMHLDSSEQEKLIRDYINIKNKEYAQNIRESFKLEQNNLSASESLSISN